MWPRRSSAAPTSPSWGKASPAPRACAHSSATPWPRGRAWCLASLWEFPRNAVSRSPEASSAKESAFPEARRKILQLRSSNLQTNSVSGVWILKDCIKEVLEQLILQSVECSCQCCNVATG